MGYKSQTFLFQNVFIGQIFLSIPPSLRWGKKTFLFFSLFPVWLLRASTLATCTSLLGSPIRLINQVSDSFQRNNFLPNTCLFDNLHLVAIIEYNLIYIINSVWIHHFITFFSHHSKNKIIDHFLVSEFAPLWLPPWMWLFTSQNPKLSACPCGW